MSAESKTRKADTIFYEIFSSFDLIRSVSPVNAAFEADRFMDAFLAGNPYSPRFEYPPLSFNTVTARRRLLELGFDDSELDCCYARTRDEMISVLDLLAARGTPDFTGHCVSLFGRPGPDLTAEATATLKRMRGSKEEGLPVVGIKRLRELFCERLRADRLEGWDAVETPCAVSLTHTDRGQHKIHLQSGLLITEDTAERLVAAEIGVHVYRAANGERQPLRALALGLDGHLVTEGGLALHLEEAMGLAGPLVRLRYAGRVLAASMAETEPFQAVFSALLPFFTPEEAYAITVRSKRGLVDTSAGGGFIYDHIAMQGKKSIESLPREDRRLLYAGRLAVHHLPLIRDMIGKKKLLEPAFTPSLYHD